MIYYRSIDGATFVNTTFEGHGYSGHGDGRNNPDMENVPNVGPIPRGKYSLELCNPEEHPRLAAPVFRLHPMPGTNVFNRSGFLIHGDNKIHDASEGCIIQGASFRHMVEDSDERELEVI